MRRCENIGTPLIFAAKIDYRSVQINNTAFHREIFQGDSRTGLLPRVYHNIRTSCEQQGVRTRQCEESAPIRRTIAIEIASFDPPSCHPLEEIGREFHLS